MANLKNINFMSKTRFDSTTTSDEELYLVDYGDIDFVVESYDDGTKWYRKYKSGWIKQGGEISPYTGTSWQTITFLKPYKNTNYNVIGSVSGVNLVNNEGFQSSNKTTTTVQVGCNTSASKGLTWEVKGQGA